MLGNWTGAVEVPVDTPPVVVILPVISVALFILTLLPSSDIFELVKLWWPAPFCKEFKVGKASEPLLPVTPVSTTPVLPDSSAIIQLSLKPSHSKEAVALVLPLSYTFIPAYLKAGVSLDNTINDSPIIFCDPVTDCI